jgi:DNA-directed RNA polymerase specialized sigma24 family protein
MRNSVTITFLTGDNVSLRRQAVKKVGFMHEARDIEALDQAMIEALSKAYRYVLQRYFLRRGLPSSDTEDMVQEVFVRLSRRRGLSDMENAAGYLFETAASVAVDYHRGRTPAFQPFP